MTEHEILALIQCNIDNLKRGSNKLLANNKLENYQLYSIETLADYMRTIKTSINTLESIVLQITIAGGSK